jgi:hypothetical protein
MGRSFTPFTRITLLLSEIRDRKIEELSDATKCDLLYHTGKLTEELVDPEQKQLSIDMTAQSEKLLAEIDSKDLVNAELSRQTLVQTTKKLKDLL